MATTPTNPVQPTPAVPLPAPPTLSDPDNFDERGDAFVAALSPMQQAINALADNAYTNALVIFGKAESAAQSANIATAQADAAMGYRNAAQNSATAASGSATLAGTHASTATAALTAMQLMYLGAKAVTSHPTTDNMGAVLQAGAMYTNTGTNAALNKRGWWWDGAAWQLAWGDITGVYMPTTGGKFTGHIEVPQGASGNQAPRANEVIPRGLAAFDKSTPMAAAPPGISCIFIDGSGGNADWPTGVGPLAPQSWIVTTLDYGLSRSVQTATFTFSGFAQTQSQFRRYRHDASWSPWARVFSDLDFRERVYIASTGAGPGDAKVYTLDPSKGSIHQLTVEYNTYFTGGLRGLGDQITLRLKFSGGAWPISFNTNFRFPAGMTFPIYSAGQTLTLTFFNTEGSFIDAFIAGVHNP